MKTLPAIVTLAAMLSAAFAPGMARGSIEIAIGGPEVSGSGAGSIPDDALTLLFDDVASNTVRLTITANPGAVKVKEIIFNVAPSITSLSFTHVSGVVATAAAFAANNQKLSGQLDDFDVKLSYSPSGPKGSLYAGKTSVYNLAAPGLTAASFDEFNDDGNGLYRAGAHINLPNGSSPSGKYGGNGDLVPEPASILVWSSLAACVAVCSRLRRRVVGNRRSALGKVGG